MFPSESLMQWLESQNVISSLVHGVISKKNLLFIVTLWEPQISTEISWYVYKSSPHCNIKHIQYMFSVVGVIIISYFYCIYTHRNTQFSENVVQYFYLKWIMVKAKVSLCTAWRNMEKWRCYKDTKLSRYTQWVLCIYNVQLRNKVFRKINWWTIHEPPSAKCHLTGYHPYILIYKMLIVF